MSSWHVYACVCGASFRSNQTCIVAALESFSTQVVLLSSKLELRGIDMVNRDRRMDRLEHGHPDIERE